MTDALQLACEALVKGIGDCPFSQYDWEHPSGCAKVCQNKSGGWEDVELRMVACWRLYCEQQAEASDESV